MKKKYFIMLVILLVISTINKVEAEIVVEDTKFSGSGTTTGGTATTCESYTVGRIVTGFKISLYNKSNNLLQTQYFKVKSQSNSDPVIYAGDSLCRSTYNNSGKTYCSNAIYELDLSSSDFNRLIDSVNGIYDATFPTFTASLSKSNQEDNLISPFANADGKSIEQFKLDHRNDYFLIEPTYFVMNCNGFKNMGSATKTYALLYGNYTARDIVNTFNDYPDSYEYLVIAPDANNLINNFYLSTNQYGFEGLGTGGQYFSNNRDGTSIGNYGATDWENLKIFLQNQNKGYGIAAMEVSAYFKASCDYNNPDHFAANRNGTAKKGTSASNLGNGSGPNSENCCSYFEYVKPTNDLYIDHPECFTGNTTPTDVFEGAYCNYTNKDVKREAKYYINDSSVWAKIFASYYRGDGGNSSSKKYLVKQNLDGNNYCHLLCYENVTLTLPEPYQPNITVGSYMKWPSLFSKYQLKLTSKVRCKVFLDYDEYVTNTGDTEAKGIVNTCVTKAKKAIEDGYELSGNFDIKTSDSKYNSTTRLSLYSNKTNNFNFNNDISTYNDLKKKEFTFEQTSYYTLPNSLYRYINLVDNSYTYIKPKDKFKDIGFGILPISEKNKNANVEISYKNIGGFTNKISKFKGYYICKYNSIDNPTPPHGNVCPTGTKYAGKDVTDLMNTYGYTLAEVIANGYCDDKDKNPCLCPEDAEYNAGKLLGYIGESFYVIDQATCELRKKQECVLPDNFCPEESDYPGLKISSACYNDDACRNKNCKNEKCPDGTDYAGEPLNNYLAIINDLIIRYPALSKEEIYKKACSKTTQKIIYRTISLDNPFPGYKGMGRTPGFNWNTKFESPFLDEDGKLKSRNTSGNDLYNYKEPLYTIELTPSIIKKIREYNKKNYYDDFQLDCNDSNDAACISSFLHDNEYFSLSGTCSKATSKDKFYECTK